METGSASLGLVKAIMKKNPKEEQVQVRIGMVNFINTAPIYEIWKKTVNRPEWLIKAAPPNVLNQMLYEEELELGCVSSFEYAAHPWKYRILSDLSISASGPVGSVFLFSRVIPEKLSDQLVLLSGQSQTSASLVKIILEEFYQVFPHYMTGNVLESQKNGKKAAAVLAIGDEALKLLHDNEYPVKLDLGEVWQKHTELPFVFAVWGVREEFCQRQAGSVQAIHQELLRCLNEGRANLDDICKDVAPRIPMEHEACLRYLQSMEYDLGPEKLKALTCFFEFLIKRGEADSEALPIKIFNQN